MFLKRDEATLRYTGRGIMVPEGAMDWNDCEIVERVPGRMSGQPVVKGTRVLAQTIVDNFEGGSTVEEIHENYPHLPVDSIRRIVMYMQTHDHQPAL
jgi:uncharacterized protein (DUF433 family)